MDHVVDDFDCTAQVRGLETGRGKVFGKLGNRNVVFIVGKVNAADLCRGRGHWRRGLEHSVGSRGHVIHCRCCGQVFGVCAVGEGGSCHRQREGVGAWRKVFRIELRSALNLENRNSERYVIVLGAIIDFGNGASRSDASDRWTIDSGRFRLLTANSRQ